MPNSRMMKNDAAGMSGELLGDLAEGDDGLSVAVVNSSGNKIDSFLRRTVRYQGEFDLAEGGRGFEGKLHGKAVFDLRANKFRSFELVAAGMRRGKTENFRGDAPPSPLGLAFIIENQYDKAAK